MSHCHQLLRYGRHECSPAGSITAINDQSLSPFRVSADLLERATHYRWYGTVGTVYYSYVNCSLVATVVST